MILPPRSSHKRQQLLLFAVLTLGLVLRGYHYLRDRAVWQDEAGLILSVSSRNFSDLFFGRLDYHQAAPPLYLCLLKTVCLLLGDSSFALRLPSFVASCAALLLFLFVARRLLTTQALPWALLLFAVSEQLLWHASEAKAYSIDVLSAAIVLAMPACPGLGTLTRQLLAFSLLSPILLLSSYPACFLCTGALFAYLPTVYRRKHLSIWLTYCGLALSVGAVMSWLVFGPIRNQHDAEIHSCWVACMPNWERPWTIPGWLCLSTLEVCRYSCKPWGQILAILAIPGISSLWRAGVRTHVRIMLIPVLLVVVASFFHRYPFGGARVMAFTIPAILTLSAAGVPVVLTWLQHVAMRKRLGKLDCLPRAGSIGLIALLLVPLISSLEQVIHPWREADIPEATSYVRGECRAADLILGNDVAQQYYFRDLGKLFHLLNESPLPTPGGDRLWVVMTAALPQAERVQLASHLAPAGWHIYRHREFTLTTVLLFSR